MPRRPAARRAARPTPTATKTTTSQRSRARRAAAGSRRAFSASTGEIEPARRAGSSGGSERHEQADREGDQPREPTPARSRPARTGSTRPSGRSRAMSERQRRSDREPERRPATPSTAPGPDEAAELAPRRAGRPQQPELADPLGDGHRERVEDQERAHEQRDRGDQCRRRRGSRPSRRAAMRRGRCGDERMYGSVVSADLERRVTSAWVAPSPTITSTRLTPSCRAAAAPSERDDDRPAAGPDERPVTGDDPGPRARPVRQRRPGTSRRAEPRARPRRRVAP